MERVRSGLRIPYEENTKLILLARELDMSKNALILKILREYLKKFDKA